jgi:hypothetical protein
LGSEAGVVHCCWLVHAGFKFIGFG